MDVAGVDRGTCLQQGCRERVIGVASERGQSHGVTSDPGNRQSPAAVREHEVVEGAIRPAHDAAEIAERREAFSNRGDVAVEHQDGDSPSWAMKVWFTRGLRMMGRWG